MKVYYDRGIIVETEDGQKLYLDPELSSTPIKYPTFVTHAHSDHTAAVSGSSTTYLSEITIDLYDITSKRNSRNYHIVDFNEPFEIGDFEIEFQNAGHLLGAAQIMIRKGSESFLYTGDFCPEDLLTVKGAQIPKEEVDLAIIDATYGDRLINFDPRVNSRQNLFLWVISQLNTDKIPILNIGHLGGAQEVITLFNKLAQNLPIIVHSKIDQVNQVYTKSGVSLDYYSIDDDIEDLLEDKCLILMPRSFKNDEKLIKRFPQLKGRMTKGIVTGQTAKYGFSSFNYASALSTHAHYDELIETTKSLNPKHVLTHYGYPEKLAESLLNDHNISAESFSLSRPVSIKNLDNWSLKKKKNGRPSHFKHQPLDSFF